VYRRWTAAPKSFDVCWLIDRTARRFTDRRTCLVNDFEEWGSVGRRSLARGEYCVGVVGGLTSALHQFDYVKSIFTFTFLFELR